MVGCLVEILGLALAVTCVPTNHAPQTRTVTGRRFHTKEILIFNGPVMGTKACLHSFSRYRSDV